MKFGRSQVRTFSQSKSKFVNVIFNEKLFFKSALETNNKL